MVIFDLICDANHAFEGWFKDADDLVEQQQQGILTCPVCDSPAITKKIAAPKLGRKSNSVATPQAIISGGDNSEQNKAYLTLQKMLGQVHEFIDANFEDVGNKFADEALSMHRGDKEHGNIRGTASREDLQTLADEGVSAIQLPPKPADKKKLN